LQQRGKIVNIVLDTNVFVAAGFNRGSSSAAIIRAVEEGRLNMTWNTQTRGETERIINQIPRLQWSRFESLFSEDSQFIGPTQPEQFELVEDYEDRKFAALADAADALLISNDDHLLSVRDRLPITVRTPGEFMRGQSG
jgi:uncharacterized protein